MLSYSLFYKQQKLLIKKYSPSMQGVYYGYIKIKLFQYNDQENLIGW